MSSLGMTHGKFSHVEQFQFMVVGPVSCLILSIKSLVLLRIAI